MLGHGKNLKQFTWSVKQQIVALCLVLVALTAVTGIAGLASVLTLSDSLHQLGSGTLPDIQALAAIQSLGLEYRGTSLLMGTPGLEATYRSKQIAHLRDLRAEITQSLATYGTSVRPAEKGAYEQTQQATATFLGTVDHFLELSLAGHVEEAGAFWSLKGGVQSKLFRKALEDEVRVSHALASEAVLRGKQAEARSKMLSIALFVAALVLGAVLGTAFSKNISAVLLKATRDLNQMSEQVTQASEQLASASNHLAETSNVQACSLEESSNWGTEVAAASKRNLDSCGSVRTLILENEQHMREATRRLDHALESMSQITESSKDIATIIRVVDEIAFRTNILALNAAVEAARAGSSGAGFAVVADEVRTLAARSAEAAQQITRSVERSVENSHSGKERLDKVVVSVHESAASTQRIAEFIEQVDREAASQSEGINRIASSLLRLRQATQETAAMAEENASAGTELQSQAELMQGVVLSLKVLV